MLFKRFFDRRKQISEDAKEVARTQTAAALRDQALSHPDTAQRLAALNQLVDLAALHRAAEHDLSADVRDAAMRRLIAVLCDSPQDEAPADSISEALAAIRDLPTLERIARAAQRAEARRLAIERVDSSAVLAECAVEDRLAANRGLAVERLEDKEALESVLRRIGKRDKNVHRIARDKLRQIAEREERPRFVRAQCEDLCAKLERLGRLGNWAQDRALLEHLERSWTEIEAEAEVDWRARFTAERARFLEAYEGYRRENAALVAEQESRDAARLAAEALLAELEMLARRPPTEPDVLAEYDRLVSEWESLPALPDAERPTLERRLRQLMEHAQTARRAIADRDEQAARLKKLHRKAAALLAESNPIEERRAAPLIGDGRALASALPDHEASAPFLDLADQLERRLKHQTKQAELKLKQFGERLQELEEYVAAGELKKADPLHQSLQAALELIHAAGVSKSQEAPLSKRLRQIAPKLRELQTWRRWGADQHREELCATMEGLIERDIPLETLSEQLRAMQADWKTLDKTGSPANQALWERFHAASETVYERCRPYMESQAAEREASRQAREDLCGQLEDFLSKVDWDKVDWKKMLRAAREMRQSWSAIGPTEGRHRKQLERRFHQSLRALDQRLDAERKLNQAHKHGLVERAKTLVELPDLDAAIEQAKALQREWHTTVPARQKDENKLWQAFRAACDAIFERRTAAQQAHASELHDNLKARHALCEEALKIAETEHDPKRIAAAQRELAERWRAAQSLPVPRQEASQASQAWRSANDTLERRRKEGEERQRLATLDLLRRQADLCQELELALLVSPADGLDAHALQARWAQLEAHRDDSLQKSMQKRFERAIAAKDDPAKLADLRSQFSANADTMRQICLQLEIIAGVESPPELAQQRLELQVARLAERMSEGEGDPLRGASHLLYDWYLCGPAPKSDALTKRFDRAQQALTKDQPNDAAPA